ncbi:hypothetical protein E2C01_009387 [Portunus trituberculatus]|uniref:Uncharacterized protein n=1 Tax=Portunus trituberculatus TaxID=210409 RepID=A0A5B7D4D9_PORTR|nr:hypothetical protein [Portunus trituberculatus]
MLAVRKQAQLPVIMARTTTLARSPRLEGAMAPKPPRLIPIELMLLNPHKAIPVNHRQDLYLPSPDHLTQQDGLTTTKRNQATKEPGTYHAQEDVGGGVDTLAGGGADGDLQEPTQLHHYRLHHAVVVQDLDAEAEEQDHRQRLWRRRRWKRSVTIPMATVAHNSLC